MEQAAAEARNRFYILGLAPNASRLAVRFFLQDTFGSFAANLEKHQKRLEIVRPAFDNRNSLSIWSLLRETANPNSRDKKPPEPLVGALLRAVLMNLLYPAKNCLRRRKFGCGPSLRSAGEKRRF